MANVVTLNVSLTARHRKIIDREVARGNAASASEVVREGLRLYEERRLRTEAVARVRAEIEAGIAQLDRGEGLDGEQVFRELKARYSAAPRAKRKQG